LAKKVQTTAAAILGIEMPTVYATSKEISHQGQGLTAVEKIFNKNAVGVTPGTVLHAGSDVRVQVNIVGSQDTTGLMTSQELEMMAATVISPTVDGSYQSGCHTASVWDLKARKNIPKLMSFMNKFGLITARDPMGEYRPMTDVIHKVLNDLTVDDWDVTIGGDSHTRMSKGIAFGADSGTVALALATGEATMPIPQSVKVTFKGVLKDHMDFRDVVHATQAQMLKKFGENVFQGKVIEVHIGTLLSDQAFTFTDWTAEMKAKASICISESETLIESLEISKSRIQIMIGKGMDNEKQLLQGLVDKADARIADIRSGANPALSPDANAKYSAEFVVDLDQIIEPMIADPDVDNDDVSKRYTHDTIRPISYYGGTKNVDLGFVGSCMVHKGDMKIISQMLRNIERQHGTVEFKAPLVVAPPTYNIVDELKEEGDWAVLQKYSGFEFDDSAPKNNARTAYQNMMYLERPGCNLCMGNQEKAEKGDTVMATSTRLFQGRVVADSDEKKGESLLASTPVVVLSTILGRTPSIDEYIAAVEGIKLTSYAPPVD
jgi:aconitate hydratase 2/2-methylisocitrate dehydratase